MKKLFLKILLVVDILAFIIYQICAMFLTKYDAASGIATDGFGRVLTRAPLIFRVQGLMEEWAGLGWFAVDTVCSFALIGIAYLLFSAMQHKK